MSKAPSKSSNEYKPNPYIRKSISKSLLTPCRQVGLSRKRKTPNNSLINSSNCDLSTSSTPITPTTITAKKGVEDHVSVMTFSPEEPEETTVKVVTVTKSNKRKASCLKTKTDSIQNDDDVAVINSSMESSHEKLPDTKRSRVARCLPMVDSKNITNKPLPDPETLKREKSAPGLEKPHENTDKTDGLRSKPISVKKNTKRISSDGETVSTRLPDPKDLERRTETAKKHEIIDEDDDFNVKPLRNGSNFAKKTIRKILSDDSDENIQRLTPDSQELMKINTGPDLLRKSRITDDETDFGVKSMKSKQHSAKKGFKRILSDDADDFAPSSPITVKISPKQEKKVISKVKDDHTYDKPISDGEISAELCTTELGSQEDNVPVMKVKKPVKTYKRSLSMKKSSSNNNCNESPVTSPFKGFPSPTLQCSIQLARLDTCSPPGLRHFSDTTEDEHSIDNLKDIDFLQDVVERKRRLLESLKQSEIYRKIHKIDDVNTATKTWKEGCIKALIDLQRKLKNEMDMPTLLEKLRVPTNLIRWTSNEELI